MNKKDCVEKLMHMFPDYLPSQTEATEIVNGFLNLIKDEVAAGRKVSLHGFGTFERTERKARTYRNFEGETVKRGRTYLPKFTPFTEFKEKCLPKPGRPKSK